MKPDGRRVRSTDAVIAAFFLVFTGGVKISPDFADFASTIPVVRIAVGWLQGDQGIKNAKEKGYKNLGPVTVSEGGFTLTLDDIFFDEDRIRLSAVVSGPRIDTLGANPGQADAAMDKDGKINGPEVDPLFLIPLIFTDFYRQEKYFQSILTFQVHGIII